MLADSGRLWSWRRTEAARLEVAPPASASKAAESVESFQIQGIRQSDARKLVGPNPVGVVVRWDRPGDKKDIRPVSRTPNGWIIGGMPEPRPLYRLPELAGDGRVWVLEGERAADAGWTMGIVATTSPHGSKSAHKADWRPLAGRSVVILPDRDDPGEAYCDDVMAILAKLDPEPEIRVVRLAEHWPDLPEGADLDDVLKLADGDVAAIRAALERLAHDAEPIQVAVRPRLVGLFQPFPVDALPAQIRAFVKAVAAATGTAPAFAALAALVVVAGCIGNRVAVRVKSGWVEPAVLWGVLVGRSGSTKSPVLKLVTRALIELHKAERGVFADATQEYQRDVDRHGVRLTKWKQMQRSGLSIDPPDEPERPAERRLIVSDVTIEKLGCLLEENPLGLLLERDELAAWIGVFDRYAGGGKGSDAPAWLSMYDAAPVTIDRKGGGTMFVERAAVSVLGSIQPGTLSRVFGRAERESGLLARVLVAYPPDLPGLWSDAELSDDAATAWRSLLEALLALPAGVDDLGDLRPRLIPIGTDAKTLWVKWHDSHARELVDIGNDDLAAHYAKLKGACSQTRSY